MMLERMRLVGFQAHDDLRIVFDERITTVVGPSDVGKSSIIRGLRWATTNRPSGSAFVRTGSKEASCTLWLDGRKLKRAKGKGVNEIELDGRRLEAFGTDLPDSAANLCNVGDVNFQGQHDPPFWLSLTAGQASRELNEVVDLAVIDRVLSAMAKEVRRANANVDLCEERRRKAESELDRLSWVPEMEKDWNLVEESGERFRQTSEELALVERMHEEAVELRRRAAVEVPDLSELEDLNDRLSDARRMIEWSEKMLADVRRLRAEVEDCSENIVELENRMKVESGGVCPLCGGKLDV